MRAALTALLLVSSSLAFAQTVSVNREVLGSGTPGAKGPETATIVNDGVFHAPQYLPGYPTAATIWPRVIEVPCTSKDGKITCQGYEWTPKYGRGEYLFIKPVLSTPAPVVPPQIQVIRETTIKEVPVLVEVPVKKTRE